MKEYSVKVVSASSGVSGFDVEASGIHDAFNEVSAKLLEFDLHDVYQVEIVEKP